VTDIAKLLQGESDPGCLWTRGGIASELLTDVVSPLCWSVWGRRIELGFRTAMSDFGILQRNEVAYPDDPNRQAVGVFYGRLAANVDSTREMMGRIPGVSASQFERDMFGGAREGIAEPPTAWHRIPEIVMKSTSTMRRAVDEIDVVHADTRAWWEREVLRVNTSPADDGLSLPAWEKFEDARRRFGETITAHIRVRFVLQSARGAFVRLAAKAGDQDLVGAVMGGYGGIADIVAADDLWRLAHDDIDLDEYLKQHGYRGSHECNLYSSPWREQPDRVSAMAATLLRRSDAPRPRDSEKVAIQKRIEAEAALIRDVPTHWRPAMRWMLAKLERVIRANQLGRSTYLMSIDGCRAAAREIGRQLVQLGHLAKVDDVFFLTVSELATLFNVGLPEASRLIADRRATHERYAAMQIPNTFVGMPSILAFADDVVTQADTKSDPVMISAASGSPGSVEGIARVILDPDADFNLDTGDVLVCRATDPSWTSLMTLAAGLVIDNGGTTSHGAIVAREIGIPCVIGTGNGTTLIRDGDRVRVDGDQGTVTVVERRTHRAPNPRA
jgi:phosphohistidine swiveling domain-containing protein